MIYRRTLTIVILSSGTCAVGLIVLAVTQSAIDTIITIICRIHIDPLNGQAAVVFAIKNFRYFGLPIELIFLAFINTILALLIWIFGKYGLIAGGFASAASFGGMWCSAFIRYYVFSWKNKRLSERMRTKREKLRKKLWKTLFPFNVCHAIKRGCEKVCEELKKQKEPTSKQTSESQPNSRQISTKDDEQNANPSGTPTSGQGPAAQGPAPAAPAQKAGRPPPSPAPSTPAPPP